MDEVSDRRSDDRRPQGDGTARIFEHSASGGITLEVEIKNCGGEYLTKTKRGGADTGYFIRFVNRRLIAAGANAQSDVKVGSEAGVRVSAEAQVLYEGADTIVKIGKEQYGKTPVFKITEK